MKIRKIKNEEYKTSHWSGGTTTELFLYPEDGDYGKRDFQIRISSATVDLEESVFTRLPSVERWLLTLDGEMTIEHAGRYKRLLRPFEIEHFQGDWETRSFGKVRDFNLMIHHAGDEQVPRGELECLEIPSGKTISLPADMENWNMLVFCTAGKNMTISQFPEELQVTEPENTDAASQCPLACVILEELQQQVSVHNLSGENVRVIVCRLAVQKK